METTWRDDELTLITRRLKILMLGEELIGTNDWVIYCYLDHKDGKKKFMITDDTGSRIASRRHPGSTVDKLRILGMIDKFADKNVSSRDRDYIPETRKWKPEVAWDKYNNFKSWVSEGLWAARFRSKRISLVEALREKLSSAISPNPHFSYSASSERNVINVVPNFGKFIERNSVNWEGVLHVYDTDIPDGIFEIQNEKFSFS